MTRPMLEQGLRHLRPRAVARAEEQHARRSRCRERQGLGRAKVEPQPGLQAATGRAEHLAATPQIDPVVRIPAVGRASASRHQPCLAKLAEVIRNEVLRFAEELCELADPTVAERQLTEQPPAKWVGYQLEELERRDFDDVCKHVGIVSNEIDVFNRLRGGAHATVRAFIDTNVLVRHLTGEPPTQARRATALLSGSRELILADLVLAEVIYVLESFYERPRAEIAGMARALLAHDSISVVVHDLLLRALELYEEARLDFAEAYLAALAELSGVDHVVSFDRQLDRVASVERVEP